MDNIPFQGSDIQVPGLTAAFREIRIRSKDVSKKIAVFSYKRTVSCLWVVFVGGTGTGKSTLFNAFCGKSLSRTGVERPKTVGPVIYAHRDCPLEKEFPFEWFKTQRKSSEDSGAVPAAGAPGLAVVLEHHIEALSHLVLVDTPDLDSIEEQNRQMAEDLYLISDAVVFVTSQEKYADDVPYQFLLRIMQDEKPYSYLLNKIQAPLIHGTLPDVLVESGLSPDAHSVWTIPYAPGQPEKKISENQAFVDFRSRLLGEFSPDVSETLRAIQQRRRAEKLKTQAHKLLELLVQENQQAEKWLAALDALCETTCHGLIRDEKKRFSADSRKHIQRQIRSLFAEYDVMAKPRRYIRELLLTPLRIIGFNPKEPRADQKDALSKVRKKIDFSPVLGAVEKFNRSVLERLSPPDETAPLYKALREPRVVLADEAVKAAILQEQDKLDAWVEETFRKLSQGLPKQKKWGIYSTSILWGILILAVETAIGGGFTMLDAILGSALAPFVTKGAVELFAYHEIQQTARELAKQYQDGLLSVVEQQRDRYEQCLQSLLTPQEIIESLQTIQNRIEDFQA